MAFAQNRGEVPLGTVFENSGTQNWRRSGHPIRTQLRAEAETAGIEDYVTAV